MAHYDDDTQDFMREVSGVKKVISVADSLARKKPIGPMLGREIVKGFLKEGSLSVLKLFGELNEKYGREWWGWDPDTMWQTFTQYDLTDEFKALVQALQVCVSTMYPFEHWHVFEKVGHAFNGNHVDFGTLQPLEPDEAALTCKVLRSIQPKEPFDPEVLGYIAACANHAGMVYLPEDLFPAGCQGYLDAMTFDHELRDRVRAKVHGEAEDVQLGKLKEIRGHVA